MKNRNWQLLLIASAIFLALSNVFGQATSLTELAKNDMKYWKIRGRLTGDDNNKDVCNGFMEVGFGAGMSIPFAPLH